jgi:hypothetical protein
MFSFESVRVLKCVCVKASRSRNDGAESFSAMYMGITIIKWNNTCYSQIYGTSPFHSLSFSFYFSPLFFCKIYVIWCPLRNIFLLINFTFFHAKSYHNLYKFHQPYTDYFLRLPYLEILEKRIFRSRTNRRLIYFAKIIRPLS